MFLNKINNNIHINKVKVNQVSPVDKGRVNNPFVAVNSGSDSIELHKSSIKTEFEQIQKQQGLIGKLWNGIKNTLHMKSGSNNVEKTIKLYEQGKITEEEAKSALDKYKAGQKMCVDVVADMLSGIIAVGAFALAVPTGGASLAVGLGLATAVGTGVKIGVKAGDAFATGKEYTKKDLLYDAATGAINGIMSPVSNGIGASVTKTIGQKLGLTIIKEGTETVVEEGVKQGIKQGVKNVLVQQSVDVAGGTILKRATALGAGMAVDGALSGASDNMIRAALNGENVIEAGVQGAVGGAIAAPVIGGGFRMASKAGRAINNKITIKKVLPDGINTKFKQGQAGDCSFLSILDGMMSNSQTQKKIKDSITKSVDGYNVRIGDTVVKVAKSSLTDEMLADTTGIKIFEQAYKQIAGDLDGGFAEVVAKQFGLNPVHIASNTITDEMLDRIAKQQNDLVLAFGTKIDADGAISSNGTTRHYFTLKNIDTDKKLVTLTSPIDTSKTIDLSYDEIRKLGISIDGGSIKQTDLPNMTRSIDDGKFFGRARYSKVSNNIDDAKYNQCLRERLIARLEKAGYINGDNDEAVDTIINSILKGQGEQYKISPIEFQRIKNEALREIFDEKNVIDINGRRILVTNGQMENYHNFLSRFNPNNVTPEYYSQAVMSDVMFIEAMAVNLGMDISEKSTQEIFEELGERLVLNGEDIFPGVKIAELEKIADAFFGRSSSSSPIVQNITDDLGADKAIHELNKALCERLKTDPEFNARWIQYCNQSPKFQQYSALADAYKKEFRTVLSELGVPSSKIEKVIASNIENEDHLIFRALQRDSLFDLDSIKIDEWDFGKQMDLDEISLPYLLAKKIQSGDTSEAFMGRLLTREGTNKFHTIEYRLKNWASNAGYFPAA